jgi:hypothetical protein
VGVLILENIRERNVSVLIKDDSVVLPDRAIHTGRVTDVGSALLGVVNLREQMPAILAAMEERIRNEAASLAVGDIVNR